tara:strand:+ start:147 stop:995 length:849 start_codon:yes stop_codon:yes gene_type:complete
MNSSCNIAICLSGEPRLNEIAGNSIKNIIKYCFANFGKEVHIDVFYHFWDTITKKHNSIIDEDINPVDIHEIQRNTPTTSGLFEHKDKLDPVIEECFFYFNKLLSDNYRIQPAYLKKWDNYFRDINKFKNIVKYTNIPTLSQVISMCKCQLVRINYEKQNDISYDIIIRSRSDVQIELDSFKNVLLYSKRPKLKKIIQFPSGNIKNNQYHFQCCVFQSSSQVLNEYLFDEYVKKICKQMFIVNVNKNKLTVKTDHEVIPHFFAEQKCKFSIPLDILKYRLIH